MPKYKCPKCSKKFSSQQIRDRHVRAVHIISGNQPLPRKEQGDPDNSRGDGGRTER